MRLGITWKLFAAILATNIIIVVAFGTAVQISVDRGFREYVEARELRRLQSLGRGFETAYSEHGSWEFLRTDLIEWRRLARTERPGRRGPPRDVFASNQAGEPRADAPPVRGERPDGPERRERARASRERADHDLPFPPPKGDPEHGLPPLTLVDASFHYVQGDAMPSGKLALSVPLSVGGAQVGALGVPRLPFAGYDSQYVEHQLRTSWLIGVLALLIASTVSLLLARNFLKPIRRLFDATHRMVAGDYTQRVAKTTHDELGQLVDDFNRLAETLQQADTRRRMFLADVSHELRTPLAVLRAELEALRDGVRPMTPDAVRSLQAEVATLGTLVNDLYDLALVDAGEATYEHEPVDLAELVRTALHAFEQRFAQRGISVDDGRVAAQPVMVRGDARRLTQLLNNVLENTHRYTDPGGRVEIALRKSSAMAVLEIDDSAPGVPPELLPRLFERLFRVESSRNRASGGAGLGLSLCRSIVEAHRGEINASASKLGGLKMEIRIQCMPT